MTEITNELLLQGTVSPPKAASFAEKAASKAQIKPPIVLKAEFIMPFTREIFLNREQQELLFRETVMKIRKSLPEAERNNITVLKTIIEKSDGRKLHTVRLLAPPTMRQSISELKMRGIDVRGKHLSAWGPRENIPNSYPKETTLYLRNIPHFLLDTAIIEQLGLPDTRLLAPIKKQRFESEDGGWYFTGTAQAKIVVESAQHQEMLKEWANTNCTRAFSMGEFEFFANIPSLLECSFCKEREMHFQGHHEKYCRSKRAHEREEARMGRDENHDAASRMKRKPRKHPVLL